MSIRTRTPSIFRPRKSIDQNVLTQNRSLVDDINRRNVLRCALSLGALSLLVAVLPALPNGIVGVAAAETTTPGAAEEAGATGKTETYLAQLRMAVPWSWLEQEFRRQRSFPALARSRRRTSSSRGLSSSTNRDRADAGVGEVADSATTWCSEPDARRRWASTLASGGRIVALGATGKRLS